MGKGDKKSKRGKIVLGTYGARRRRKEVKKMMPAKAVEVEKSEGEAELKEAKPKRKVKTTSGE
jgi:30S ribosomal protein S31